MSHKKNLDIELNLVAFISLLAVLISSLLLTSVWIHIGSMTVKQAVGGASTQKKEKPQPILWAHVKNDGSIFFKLERAHKVPRSLRSFSVPKAKKSQREELFQGYLSKLRKRLPSSKIAFIKPSAGAFYEDIIQVMDFLKAEGWVDLGINPL